MGKAMRAIFFLLFLLLFVPMAFPSDVNLAWDASVSPNIAGYKVYVGTVTRTYGAPIVIGNQTTYTVTGLGPGTYYFAVTAFNAAGDESDFSNEVNTTLTGWVQSVNLAIQTGPDIVQLNVSSVSSTAATIVWATTADCSGTVLYGTDPSRLLAVKANNLGTTDHLVVITGLTPRTHYFYKAHSVCGEKPLESPIRSFNTK
jgi:hypothetical protein